MRRIETLAVAIIFGSILVVVAIFFFFQLGESQPAMDLIGIQSGASGIQVGLPAPTFELRTLGGRVVKLEDLRGQVVLLNFWATWCGPCRLEMPTFQEFYEDVDGLEIVAVNVGDHPDNVEDFILELELTFIVLMDPDKTAESLYGIQGIPTSYIIDQDGIIRAIHIGIMTEGQLDGYLSEAGITQ
jgi:thiol-disulfide isomerase/thioredoxin